MATEKLHNLRQTSCPFQVRGIVTGVDSDRFYTSGITKSGNNWNKINFGVKVNENKTIYVSLNGFPRNEVFYYKRSEIKGQKGDTARVPWNKRHESPGDGYRLIGINISTGKTDDGKNINTMFTEYDAVEWISENLKDGDSVFIKGNIEFSSREVNGEMRRYINLIINQLSYTQMPVDFTAESFKEMCHFDNELVYKDIDQETDENGRHTGRFILSGYSIGYNSVENVSFLVGKETAMLAKNIKKTLKPGNFIKTFGMIDMVGDFEEVEVDDGWGGKSMIQRANSPVKTEYVIYGADKDSIDIELYSEKEIMNAIKKIKANREAEKNFGDTSAADLINAPWNDDGGLDDSDPWG